MSTAIALRSKITALQDEMQTAIARGETKELEIPIRHTFIDGGYAREMTAPAGALIVGKIHRYACFNFVMRGRITVLTEDGVKDIQAPASFISGPGVKRVGYVHEDVIWTTVHVVDETDPAKLEDLLTVPSYDEWLAIQGDAA